MKIEKPGNFSDRIYENPFIVLECTGKGKISVVLNKSQLSLCDYTLVQLSSPSQE
jgi:hypothetical protein